MPGLQLASYWEGNRAELFATYVLSSVAAVVAVPREVDFGLDLLCTLTHREKHALYAGRSFGVQVKSASEKLISYGGLGKKGKKKRKWKRYEIDWLFGQSQPIIICMVDLKQWRLSLYSTIYMWSLRWKKGIPGEVILAPDQEPNESELETGEYPSEKIKEGEACGDGFSYLVPLGKPFVEVFLKEEETQDFRDNLRKCLDLWLLLDYKNIVYREMKVPFVAEWIDWDTNVPPKPPVAFSQFWNPGFDMNILNIMMSIGPATTSLMLNLDAQNQYEKLESVIPFARLVKSYEALDPLGEQFLMNLDAK